MLKIPFHYVVPKHFSYDFNSVNVILCLVIPVILREQIAKKKKIGNSSSYLIFLCTKQGLFTESIVKKLDWPAQTPDLNSLNSFEMNWIAKQTCRQTSLMQSSASMFKHHRERPSQTNRSCYSSIGRHYCLLSCTHSSIIPL